MKSLGIAVLVLVAWLLLPWPAGAAGSQDDLRQGLAALNRNDLVHAREFLERAAKLDPRSAVVWMALAQTYLKSGQKDMAAQAAGRAEQFGATLLPSSTRWRCSTRAPATSPRPPVGAPLCGHAWSRRASGRNAAALSLEAGQPERGREMGRGRIARSRHP